MFVPDTKILKKYADVLIKFALWGGTGAKKGDVIYLAISESAKPFLLPLQQSILESGAHLILGYHPEGISRSFFEHASAEQLTWMPKAYLLARLKTITHSIGIISTDDKFELKGIDSKKIMDHNKAMKFYMEARRDKESAGKFTWTLGLYGTAAMAREVKLSLKEYWDEIIAACFLDYDNPIAKWREVSQQIETTKTKLNALKIDELHAEGKDVDLHVKLGRGRNWLGGSGRNIPSFELFISPDWRGTNGWIKFNQPLYRYGNMVTGIELKFKDGLVVEAKAKQNEKLLKDMIAVENANKIGEYSLTDARFSRITKFMGETLYDENVGGKYGNTHLALGSAYRDSYDGDIKKMKPSDWKRLGYNESAVHTDIVSTTNRTVTATLTDGAKKIIYQNGQFQV